MYSFRLNLIIIFIVSLNSNLINWFFLSLLLAALDGLDFYNSPLGAFIVYFGVTPVGLLFLIIHFFRMDSLDES